jgi:hypothetical protein
MFWALLPDPASDDEKGFTAEQLEGMGAGRDKELFQALRDAADRGMHIRILQIPGFSGQEQESAILQGGLPQVRLDPFHRHERVVWGRRHHAPSVRHPGRFRRWPAYGKYKVTAFDAAPATDTVTNCVPVCARLDGSGTFT